MKIFSSSSVAVLWLCGSLLTVMVRVQAIYPPDHFTFVTELHDREGLDAFVTAAYSNGQTALVRWIATPAWNRAVRAFQGNNQVVFGDVNLAEAAPDLRGPPHHPGSGGWPTIRYFNNETGIQGGSYSKKTSKSICDELGTFDAMVDYIEEYGKTVLCGLDTINCNEQEVEFLHRMNRKSAKEIEQEYRRLVGIDVERLQEGLQEWNLRRRRILSKLLTTRNTEESSTADGKDDEHEL